MGGRKPSGGHWSPRRLASRRAARKHGLWLPSGFEEDGVFYETLEHLPPHDEEFQATLEEVLQHGLYAVVRTSETPGVKEEAE
jgi:hypothetical protein